MRSKPNLSQWDEREAVKFVLLHERGKYGEAAAALMEMFVWDTDPESNDGCFWYQVHEDLQAYPTKPREDAVQLIMSWIRPPAGLAARKPEPVAKAAVLSEAAVAMWLKERGMVMIKAEDLRELKRHGRGGVPKINAKAYRSFQRA